MSQVFISYRRDDSADVAGRIYDRLVHRYGPDNVFKDVDNIPLGIDFRRFLGEAVGRCRVLLAIIGRQWLHVAGPAGGRRLDDPGDFVRLEIEAALRRDIPVIPVLVSGAAMPGQEHLPAPLQELAFRNGILVRPDPDFHRDVDRLLKGLDQLLQGQTRQPQPGEVVSNALGMKFAWIPPGTFLMGSPPSEEKRSDGETQHRVMLTKGFNLGVHQVTRGQFARFVEEAGYQTEAERGGGACAWTGKEWKLDPSKNWRAPGFAQADDHPVVCVSWNDAVALCDWLTKQDGQGRRYRLPTEAEWEYACRAGTATPFAFGATISTDRANYDGNYIYGQGKKGVYRQATTPVGSFPPNAWGLFDMHGNVWEWCQDWSGPYPKGDVKDQIGPEKGDDRVLRGGSWCNRPNGCRSACRNAYAPAGRYGR
jgi:formylglycine-generating enzyme required for sulfatase activity